MLRLICCLKRLEQRQVCTRPRTGPAIWSRHQEGWGGLQLTIRRRQRQLLDNFWTTFGQLWDNFWSTLRQTWDNFETLLGKICDNLRQLLTNSETICGQICDNSWPTLRQTLAQLLANFYNFEITLGPLWVTKVTIGGACLGPVGILLQKWLSLNIFTKRY